MTPASGAPLARIVYQLPDRRLFIPPNDRAIHGLYVKPGRMAGDEPSQLAHDIWWKLLKKRGPFPLSAIARVISGHLTFWEWLLRVRAAVQRGW